MPSPACPDQTSLEQLLLGLIDGTEADALERHVSDCAACSDTLRELSTHDELVDALRAAAPIAAPDAELSAVLSRMRKSPQSSAANSRPAAPADGSQQRLGTIREYRLLAKLGEGGMGTVYQAQHTKLKRMVAIKVLPPDRVQSPEAIARFEREMQAVGALDDPNIVRALDAGEHEGRHYLVMEYVKGRDASELVPGGKTLAVADACEIVRQAAIGLQHAYEAGLVHRDIKPSNLMVSDGGVVKILDLGLALIAHEMEGGRELTSSGAVMGTIDYMAPEQASDTHDVDIRADIYSLGATLYRLLTGAAPFSGQRFDSPVKKLLALATQPPPPVHSKRPEVTGALSSLISNLLAKDPEDRLPTPAEVAEALQPFCGGADLPMLIASLPAAPPLPLGEGRGEGESHRKTEPSFSNPTGDTAPTIDRVVAAGAVGNADPGVPSFPLSPGGRGTGGEGAAVARLRTTTSGGRRIPRSIVIATACGGAALAVLLGIIFFLQTPDGTVRVEINDPDIKVVLDDNDNASFQGAGKHKIILKPGPHGITITRGDLTFGTTSFELKKGDKARLKIDYIAGKVQVTKDGAALPVTPLRTVVQTGWHGWPADAPPPAIAPFDAAQAKQHQEAWAKHLGVPVEWENSLGMRFRLIPPGEYLMGSKPEEIEEALRLTVDEVYWQNCIKSEAPQHKVILTQPIYLGVYEVTQAEYEKVMGTNPSFFAKTGTDKQWVDKVAGLDTASYPVEGVSWNDCAEFCAKLSAQEKLKPFYSRSSESVTMLGGNGYRLPTEAQWEFACRAGTTTRHWSGDTNEALARAAWFNANSGERTHAVGELAPNPFGLFDIQGNVWEWVADEWSATYYGQFPDQFAIDPSVPPATSFMRTFRGGIWYYSASSCRAAFRHSHKPDHRARGIGVRVALPVEAVRESTGSGGFALEFHGKDSYVELPTPPPLKIAEPPPLAQWLKDREVLTVAQDGQARFKTIQAALDALQPGQVIRVLDRGPYRERLEREHLPDDSGLISEQQTILELAEWGSQPNTENLVGHFLGCGEGFRLHGFVLSFPTSKKDGHALYVWNPSGLVFENCLVQAPQPNELIAAVMLNAWGQGQAATQPAWVRDCLFRGQLIVTGENAHSVTVIERNFIAGPGNQSIGIGGHCSQVVIRHNVLGGGVVNGDLAFDLKAAKALEVYNNTSLSESPLFFARTIPEGQISFLNNLRVNPGFLALTQGAEHELPTVARTWRVGGNAYPRQLRDGELFTPQQNLYPAQKTDVVGKMKFLSLDTSQADYLRLSPESPPATKGVGGNWPTYIGALPPGPAPKEGDWFSRLRQRWSDGPNEARNFPPPLKIEEPPPLEDWLQGRKLRTVAQDGSGEFKTIQAALDALKKGEVVKVLDKGPYRESLRLTDPPADIGLVSEQQTVVEIADWMTHKNEFTKFESRHGHRIFGARGFRLSGFDMLGTSVSETTLHVELYFEAASDVTVEECGFRFLVAAESRNPPAIGVDFNGFGADPTRPIVVRQCAIGARLSAQGWPKMVAPPVLFVRNFVQPGPTVEGIHVQGQVRQVFVRNNVVKTEPTNAGIVIALHPEAVAPEILDIAHNTVVGVGFNQFALTAPRSGVMIRENVLPSAFRAALGAEENLDAVRDWQIDGNWYLIRPESDPDHEKLIFRRPDDPQVTPRVLSADPKDTNFARLAAMPDGRTAGALPPGPAPPDGDWFSRLRERRGNP